MAKDLFTCHEIFESTRLNLNPPISAVARKRPPLSFHLHPTSCPSNLENVFQNDANYVCFFIGTFPLWSRSFNGVSGFFFQIFHTPQWMLLRFKSCNVILGSKWRVPSKRRLHCHSLDNRSGHICSKTIRAEGNLSTCYSVVGSGNIIRRENSLDRNDRWSASCDTDDFMS